MADDSEDKSEGSGGLLSPLLDPIGAGLEAILHPAGAIIEPTITEPVIDAVGSTTRPLLGPILGDHEERLEILGGDSKDPDTHKTESTESTGSIGGKEQTAANPLGLNYTGR